VADHGQADISAEQQKLALGKIHHAGRFKNNHEAERHERVNTPNYQAIDHQLQKKIDVHGLG
jgi:hypothetical protein